MAAEAVGVKLNLKLTNLMAGEHMKPEYLKVSCLHTPKSNSIRVTKSWPFYRVILNLENSLIENITKLIIH